MLRPIDGDGTSRYSTGRPGLENAPAVAAPPPAPTRPDNRAAPMAATASRRGVFAAEPRNFSTNFMLYPSQLSSAAYAVESVWASETQWEDATRPSWPQRHVAVS